MHIVHVEYFSVFIQLSLLLVLLARLTILCFYVVYTVMFLELTMKSLVKQMTLYLGHSTIAMIKLMFKALTLKRYLFVSQTMLGVPVNRGLSICKITWVLSEKLFV